jgi:tetratricopeptide (TPR) repeat protein
VRRRGLTLPMMEYPGSRSTVCAGASLQRRREGVRSVSVRAGQVFLSHTSDLQPFVTAAESAVSKAGGSVADMRYFAAQDAAPAKVCRKAVAQSDVYVLIAGLRYGSLVPDLPDVSYTEFEFEVATTEKIPRLVFLLDADTAGDGSPVLDQGIDERQEAFRRRLTSSGLTTAKVSTPDGLESALLLALFELPPSRPAPERAPDRRPVLLALLLAFVLAVGLVATTGYFWPPAPNGPDRMTGEFNVLFVPIVEGDGLDRATADLLNGTISNALRGGAVAGRTEDPQESLRVEFREAAAGTSVADQEVQRRDDLADLARTHDADVVLTGHVIRFAGGVGIDSELYIRRDPSGEVGQLAGIHRAGVIRIPADGALDPVERRSIRVEIASDVQNAADLINSMTFYANGDYQGAVEVLERIGARPPADVDDPTLRGAVGLMLGNAFGRLGKFAEAEAAYESALRDDPTGLRPVLGLAELEYQRACAPAGIDADLLRANIESYDRVVRADNDDRAVAEDIDVRATFGKARAELCLGMGLDDDAAVDRAALDFTSMIEALQDGDGWRLPSLAAEAMANQALADVTGASPLDRQAHERALAAYVRAGRTGETGARKALFFTQAAALHRWLGDPAAAAACLGEAREIDPETTERIGGPVDAPAAAVCT